MSYAVTLIPGDGIGPELADATRYVLEATGIGFEWDVQEAGEATIAAEGTPLPDRVVDSIRSNGVAIKGPITTPVGGGFRSVNVALRQALELYANVRPARTRPRASRSSPAPPRSASRATPSSTRSRTAAGRSPPSTRRTS